jgi:DNA polymerase-1
VTRLLFDLEGDGLLEATETAPAISKIHCIATVDIDTGEERFFGPDDLDAALEHLRTADELWGQNVLRYDFPVLEKLKNFVVPFEKKRDLLVVSRVKHPNLKETDARLNKSLRKQNKPTIPPAYFGSHTVGAWGYRLGEPKLHEDITDWSTYTPEMGERCVGDVKTSLKWFHFLAPEKMSQTAIELEHETQDLCERMTRAGWPFNEGEARKLHAALVDKRDKIEKELKRTFGGWWVNNGLFTPKVNNKKIGYVAGQQCTKIEWVEFNPKSHPHIEKVLRGLGWQPTEFTENGAAKTDEEIIESVAAIYPEAEGLVEYLMVCKRLGQLATGKQAWLGAVKNGRIHGNYNPMGTVTSRAAHFGPNLGQVPSVSRPYGKECRALFGVPEGWEQVGADMEGLELRGLAHYMAKYDDGAFGREVLEGDPHWNNVIGFGFFPQGTVRDKHNALHTILREKGAKTGIYAIVYGCGNEKLGQIILDVLRVALKECPEEARPIYQQFFGDNNSPGKRLISAVGKKARDGFLANLPALAEVKHKIGGLADKYGWVPGLDGRRVPSRSEHSAVNAVVQSAGAILCKRWITNADKALAAAGYRWGWDGDYVFLGWIHDEVQVACRKGLGDKIGEILVREAQRAGEPYSFRIRLDSKYVIGRNWAETH